MDRLKRLRHFFEVSDWKKWLVIGVMLIGFITFIQDVVIEHQIKQANFSVMGAIDHEEEVLHHSEDEAEKRDQSVDEAFDKAMQSSQEVIYSSGNKLNSIRQDMNMDQETHHAP